MAIVKIMAKEFVLCNSVYFADLDTKQSLNKQTQEAALQIKDGRAKQNLIKVADDNQEQRKIEVIGLVPYELRDARTEYKTAKTLIVALKEKAKEENGTEDKPKAKARK